MPHYSTIWWTAFGAIAQAAGALATFAAVVVSLWIALSGRALKARGSAGIRVHFIGDGTPGTYTVGIEVLNIGLRPFHVNSVGWRTGWMQRGPEPLRYRFALQNTSMMLNQRPGPHIVDPGRNEGWYTLVADMKGANSEESRSELFVRKLPILGFAPIRAVVNITGRKPLYIKVSDDLADFLRTGEHASTTAEENK
jgi:hypothetical protein